MLQFVFFTFVGVFLEAQVLIVDALLIEDLEVAALAKCSFL